MSRATNAFFNFVARDRMTANLNKMGRSSDTFMNRLKRNARTASLSIQTLNNNVNKLTGGLTRMIPGLGLLSAGGVAYFGKDALDTSAKMEALATSISFASGSAAAGAQNMTYLRNISRDLKIDFMSAAEGFNLFAANAKAANIPMEEIKGVFTGVSKMIRVQGLDAQKTESTYRALGEMYSRMRIQAQEMNIQLAQSLPGSRAWMAQAAGFGDDIKGFIDAMSKGELVSKDILPKFAKIISDIADEGLPKSLLTSTARMANISNQWRYIKGVIGDAIVDTGLLGYVERLAESSLKWMQANKELIGIKMKGAFDETIGFGRWIVTNWSDIKTGLGAIAIGIGFIKAAAVAANLSVLLANPITAAAFGLGALGVASVVGVKKSSEEAQKLRKDSIRDTKKDLNATQGFMLGIDNMFFGKKGNTWIEDMKKGAIGFVQILISGLQSIYKSLNMVGWMSDEKFGRLSKVNSDWIKQLDKTAQTPGSVGRHKKAMTGLYSTQTVDSIMPTYLKSPEETYGLSPFKTDYLKKEKEKETTVNINITKQEGISTDVTTAGSADLIFN